MLLRALTLGDGSIAMMPHMVRSEFSPVCRMRMNWSAMVGSHTRKAGAFHAPWNAVLTVQIHSMDSNHIEAPTFSLLRHSSL